MCSYNDIVVKSKYNSIQSLRKEYPSATIIDVTSRASDEMIQFSPFYPHGGIPVPFSAGWTAASVESIWQGLKVFANADIDTSLFRNTTMHNLKRSAKKYGTPIGHRKGVDGEVLLDYISARKLIYVPSYNWVLDNKVSHLIRRIKEISLVSSVILLDYNTNTDINNPRQPLSHASLIVNFIKNRE